MSKQPLWTQPTTTRRTPPSCTPAGGRLEVADAYDISLHLHHPGPRRSALFVNGSNAFSTLSWADVEAEICSWGLDTTASRVLVGQTVDALAQAWAVIDQRLEQAKQ